MAVKRAAPPAGSLPCTLLALLVSCGASEHCWTRVRPSAGALKAPRLPPPLRQPEPQPVAHRPSTPCPSHPCPAGADPLAWTVPPSLAGSGSEGEGNGSDEEEEAVLPTYEGVCRSELYQLLKQLLPSQAEFPHTFTLAQLLLRAPLRLQQQQAQHPGKVGAQPLLRSHAWRPHLQGSIAPPIN